jgi:hypothetical protein
VTLSSWEIPENVKRYHKTAILSRLLDRERKREKMAVWREILNG